MASLRVSRRAEGLRSVQSLTLLQAGASRPATFFSSEGLEQRGHPVSPDIGPTSHHELSCFAVAPEGLTDTSQMYVP
eukprot:scaffold515750_cov24-Prasinocladus_malaysianus.AAC.1